MGGDGVRLANPLMHFWSRGPGKALAENVTKLVEQAAPPAPVSPALARAVDQGLARQAHSQPARGVPAVGCELWPAFTDLSQGWTVLGANADRGFSGASFWAQDAAGRRAMIKLQDTPEGAANERLAYALGRALGQPVNEVQIGIWQGKLATLHYDVARPGEQAVPFLDLPAAEQAALLRDPRLVQMDLFDRVIQNADRNPRNILVTKPREGAAGRPGVYLIDHTNSFGVGHLDFVALYAAKFRVRPLAVAHFSPPYEARAFRRHLSGLSPAHWRQDRPLLRRFGNLSDARLDALLAEIRDVVPPDQFLRTRHALQLKRDVAREAARLDRPPTRPVRHVSMVRRHGAKLNSAGSSESQE